MEEVRRVSRNGVKLRRSKTRWWPGKEPSAFNDYNPQYIPTLDELHEVIGPIQEATIRQVVTGQAYYYGYDVIREFDNEIPMIGNPTEYEPLIESGKYSRNGDGYRERNAQKMRNRLEHMIRKNERSVGEKRRIRTRIVQMTAKFLGISKEEALNQLKLKGCL